MRTVAILASHNRRELTLACLESFYAQDSPENRVEVVLTDDGSTDGTAAAIVSRWPQTTIISADGSLFWAGGMGLADSRAWESEPDFLLWLNDDTILDPGALSRLVALALSRPEAVIVGATRDPVTHQVSYGGFSRKGRHPQRLRRAHDMQRVLDVDTFNGNCVLIPKNARERLGAIDASYHMEAADVDYGYRARKLGIPMLALPGFCGECSRDSRAKLLGGPRARWRQMNGPKGILPWRAQVRFLKAHGGVEWPIYLVWGYVRHLFGGRMKGSW
jgi:GT2 family glycosyltransferase